LLLEGAYREVREGEATPEPDKVDKGGVGEERVLNIFLFWKYA